MRVPHDTKIRASRYFLIALTLLAVVILRDVTVVGHVLPRTLIHPSPRSIAQTFVESVATGNIELAKSLTDGSPECVASMVEIYEWYSPRFLGVPINELVVTEHSWQSGNPSKEAIVFVFSNIDSWTSTAGVASLSTTYRMFGRRYVCGGFAGFPVTRP